MKIYQKTDIHKNDTNIFLIKNKAGFIMQFLKSIAHKSALFFCFIVFDYCSLQVASVSNFGAR